MKEKSAKRGTHRPVLLEINVRNTQFIGNDEPYSQCILIDRQIEVPKKKNCRK